MDRVLSDLQPGLGTTAIVGELTLTKTGTTARTVTFPDAAITVAGADYANNFTGTQTFDVIKTQHCDAATSAGVHIGNASHQDVAIFGAGGGQGTTFYGQINGTTQSMSGQITSTVATGSAPFVVASTTKVANLNVDFLNGTTWAAPGAIGGTTPAAGAFTTLTTTDSISASKSANAGFLSFFRNPNAGSSAYTQVTIGNDASEYTGSIAVLSDANTAYGAGLAGGMVLGTNFAKALALATNGTARLTIDGAGAATFASSVSCSALTASGSVTANFESDSILTGRFIGGYLGYTGIRQGATTHDFYIDVYNGGALLNALRIQQNGAATFASSVEGPKVKLTPEGGFATLVVADEAVSVGHVCAIIQGGTANRVKRCPISGNENDMPVGVAYSAAGAAGDSFWMVVSGRVGVLPDTGTTAAQGYILYTSATTAGLATQAATAPAAATHFKEIGHFINTGSGAGVITDAIVHFN